MSYKGETDMITPTKVKFRNGLKFKVAPDNVISLPVTQVCKMCVTYMTDKCDPCIKNGMDEFELKPHLGVSDMPRFPSVDEFSKYPVNIRQIVVAVYLQKIFDLLR